MAEDDDHTNTDPFEWEIDVKEGWQKHSKTPSIAVLTNVLFRFTICPSIKVQKNSSKENKDYAVVYNMDGLIDQMDQILTLETLDKIKEEYKTRLTMKYFEKKHGKKILDNDTGEDLKKRMKRFYQIRIRFTDVLMTYTFINE